MTQKTDPSFSYRVIVLFFFFWWAYGTALCTQSKQNAAGPLPPYCIWFLPQWLEVIGFSNILLTFNIHEERGQVYNLGTGFFWPTERSLPPLPRLRAVPQRAPVPRPRHYIPRVTIIPAAQSFACFYTSHEWKHEAGFHRGLKPTAWFKFWDVPVAPSHRQRAQRGRMVPSLSHRPRGCQDRDWRAQSEGGGGR